MEKSYDVVIVGGAVMGSALAYFLAKSADFNGRLLVIEKDPGYQYCSTTLSASSIRQQFSTPENIWLSQFSVDFFRHMSDELAIDTARPTVSFTENGYLLLADKTGASILTRNHALQTRLNADISLMSNQELAARFPWLNAKGINLATFGETGEGWFDGYSLLQALKKKAKHLGVEYLQDQVCGIDCKQNQVAAVILRDGRKIACGVLVNAAGPSARALATMANLNLPVEARKRFVFVFHCRESIPNCPLVIGPNGIYFRPEGNHFICGMSPDEADDKECFDFDVDYSLFDERIWPGLASLVPAFEQIKLTNAWAGHYAYNTFDQNAILGSHPDVGNFIFMNGFSGHGLQHAPGVGRGIAELIVYGEYRSLNLKCFSFDRILNNEPLKELNVF